MIKWHCCPSTELCVGAGVQFGCAESTPPRVEMLPPRVKRRSLNEEDLRPALVCVFLKKPVETSRTCLQKAVLLHLHGFSIPQVHALQWRLSPKYRKPPCSGVLSSHGFRSEAITHHLSRCCVKLASFQPWKSGLLHQSLQIFWHITGWVTSWLHQADSWAHTSQLI